MFVRVELRAGEPLVRLPMPREANVGCGDLLCLLSAAAAMAASTFSMFYMQSVLGMGPMAAGLGTLPVTVAILLARPAGGCRPRRVDRAAHRLNRRLPHPHARRSLPGPRRDAEQGS
ncbi:hypothetical protein [Actinomadura sediminis]|uniref:MFS transporter n=1 Tax=Actinomadura sediminis TaxID=1038904 RepID=A0ABW3EQR9_9ACTN